MYIFAKGQVFRLPQSLTLYLCVLMGILRRSPIFTAQAFLETDLTYASLGWFPFLNITYVTNLERPHQAASHATSSCLSFFIISLFSETSLPPLHVALTTFALSLYERALGLPTSFPISGVAGREVKPRLSGFSWRDLASTHPLMFSSFCPSELFLAFPPSPPVNLSSFSVRLTRYASTLTSFFSSRCGTLKLALCIFRSRDLK